MGLRKRCRWQRNTGLEKVLFVTLLVLTFIILLFISLSYCCQGTEVCNDPECIRTATHILDTTDPSADPCENFYNFACGGLVKNPLSSGQPNTLQYLKDLMKNQLREIVVETTDERNLPRSLVTQRKFYRACINNTAIEEDKDQTFLRLLDELLGGWPAVKGRNWNHADFEWSKAMVKARKLGLFHEFFFRVSVSSRENTSMISVRPPHEKDVSSFYWQAQNLDLIHETALKWGASRSVRALEDLRKTMHFAEQLHQIVRKFYNRTTARKPDPSRVIALRNLDHKLFKLNWFELLTNVTGVPLKKDHLVVFDAEDYFTDLYYVLLMKTPKRTQANFISWAVISNNLNYLTKKIRGRYKKIARKSTDTAEIFNRRDFCYKTSAKIFEHVAEAEYIRRHTPPNKREYVKDIIKNVKQELEKTLQKNSWMDEITKHFAIDRLRNITEYIGGTDVVYDLNAFERTFGYHRLKTTSDKVVTMKREVTLNRINHYYKQLLRKGDAIFSNIPRLDVNFYYNKYLKKLMLPTHLLQGHVFNEKRPRYVNYGSLGSIIGHEFTRGLTGYFPITNLSGEVTLWSNKTRENFDQVRQCLTDKYKNESTVLADFSGVDFAYAAYQNWFGRNSQEESLPGVKYTPSQIFWIMASSNLCSDSRLGEKNEATTLKTHSVSSLRVNTPLRNSLYFARDFRCPVGSGMNPKEKCQIFT